LSEKTSAMIAGRFRAKPWVSDWGPAQSSRRDLAVMSVKVRPFFASALVFARALRALVMRPFVSAVPNDGLLGADNQALAHIVGLRVDGG